MLFSIPSDYRIIQKVIYMLKEWSLRLFNNEELIGMSLAVIAALLFITLIFQWIGKFRMEKETPIPEKTRSIYQKSRPKPQWTLHDLWLVTMITVSYAIVSLWNLGTLNCPENYWQPVSENESVTLMLTETTEFDAIYWISGEGDNNANPTTYQVGADFQVLGSQNMEDWEYITTLSDASYMAWKINDGQIWNYRYIKIIANNRNVVLHEIGLRKADHSGFLSLQLIGQSNPQNPFSAEALIDEQQCLVLNPTWFHGTYFDEIYHPRNAYEIAEGQAMYASVHPLFGTTLMALCIRFFGLNPFGWRIGGALFGIAMLPLFYSLCKRIFEKRRYAAIGTLLFAVDFMHYTTSRIGTLEPYSVFFILLMVKFMVDYVYLSFYDTRLTTTLKPLAASGIAMSLAIATKWTGVYAAVGLAILFFSSLFQRYQEYRRAKTSRTPTAQEQFILTHWKRYTVLTLLFCIVFFVIIPVVFYFAAYLPCMLVKNEPWSIQGVIDQTLYMFRYHATLEATHPFQSTWIQWIFDLRPIWYYYSMIGNTVYTISAFGNPLLWWSGLASVVACLVLSIKKRDGEGGMILVCYFAQLVPWLLVTRCVFIYHYYPSVPFLILAIVYLIRFIDLHHPEYHRAVQVTLVLTCLLFVLFLPVIGGFGTTHSYIDHVLRWMPSWYFGVIL